MAENMNTVRSYEVSIWTLQDRFLSVLKWPNMDCKGQIQEPEVVLRDDGTQTFTFSIPKYYYNGASRIVNPMWLHLENQPLEANMHKLKVIFNKGTDVERVFEFLVTEVTHDHTADNVTLTVKSEGLAFHELGKIGYKISLSDQNYLDALDAWTKGGMQGDQPINNLQFWNDLVFKNSSGEWITNWTYEVRMEWSSFSTQSSGATKYTDTLYENEYVSSWTVVDEELFPKDIQTTREMCRLIEIKESNIYNITQTIAEQFGVFCRYEYQYNDNYQIIGRKVIYYNNYLYDVQGHIDLTYPYSSTAITRTVDSSNVISKMYVNGIDYDSQLITIMNLEANRSGEDYLLNFDYLHDIQAISDEQYAEIPKYEASMHELNKAIADTQERIRVLENYINELKAKKTVHDNSESLANDRWNEAKDLREKLTCGTNLIEIQGTPCVVLKADSRGFYINIRWEGLVRESVRLYQTNDLKENENSLGGEISSFIFAQDEFQNVIRIDRLEAPNPLSEGDTIWLYGRYNPHLAYDRVQDVWQKRKNYDEGQSKKLDNEIKIREATLQIFTIYVEQKIAEKQTLLHKFERMMGPALREGYWNPENYRDDGDLFTDRITVSYLDDEIVQGETPHVEFIWDSAQDYENEEALVYYVGAEGDKLNQHLTIDISDCLDKVSAHLDDLCFVYADPAADAAIKDMEARADHDEKQNWINALKKNMYSYYQIGSGCELGWVRSGSTRKPVLIVTGAKELDDDMANFLQTNVYTTSYVDVDGERIKRQSVTAMEEAKSFIAYPAHDEHGNTIFNLWNKIKTVGGNSSAFIGSREVDAQYTPETYPYVREYPRLYFNTLKLQDDTVAILKDKQLLNEYEDYYLISDDRSKGTEPIGIGYYATIKPEILFAAPYTDTSELSISYSLSNLDIAIYLDAIKVMNENARPKVSYDLELSVLNPEFVYTAYNRLNQIVHINDNDLQLENVSGYISSVTMKLDRFWEDTVEVQNYTTKFEDLFSTIVAQSAAMQRNGNILAALAAGGGNLPINSQMWETALYQNANIMQAYVDSCFDSSVVVENKLREIFTEASEILSESNKTLNRLGSLSLKNADILQGFVSNIATELSPKTFYSTTKPDNYKAGDVWVEVDSEGNILNNYVATSAAAGAGGLDGFTKTFDGSLAAITGGKLEVDAAAGTVSILAQNRIDMKSGGNIYIAANEKVDIVGNKYVNIGGATINIAAAAKNIDGDSVGYDAGGINIISSQIDFESETTSIEDQIDNAVTSVSTGTSKVLIHPTKIEMGSADIIMRGANKIQMVTSRGASSNTSAIEISPENGVWIGSGHGVTLFSGKVTVDNNGEIKYRDKNDTILNVNGASVELNAEHLIMGYANTQTSTGTAIEMNEECVIIAAGNYITGDLKEDKKLEITGSSGSGGLIGAKFTKDSIGFATSSNGTINAILMNNKGVTVGSGGVDITQSTTALHGVTGSYVRIASDGIDIGSLANLYINSNNFKLQTDTYDSNGVKTDRGDTIMAIGKNLQMVDTNTVYDPASNQFINASTRAPLSTAPTVDFLLNDQGVYVRGAVYATAFILANDVEIPQNKITGLYASLGNQTQSTIKVYTISTSDTTAPAKPTKEVVPGEAPTSENPWATYCTEYPTTGGPYYYYSCIQTKLQNGTVTFSTPTLDRGLTSSAATAEGVRSSMEPITTHGLSSGTWHGQDYAVILGNASAEHPMLIGSNKGIHIANTDQNGEAIILDGKGIALNAASLHLKAQASDTDDASLISLTTSGIIIRSSRNLTVGTNNLILDTTQTGKNIMFGLGDGQQNKWKLKYSISDGLEIEGAVRATELWIEGKKAKDFVIENSGEGINLDDYMSYADLTVSQQDAVDLKQKKLTAYISQKVWDTMGNNSSITIVPTGITVASTGFFTSKTANFTLDSTATGENAIFDVKARTDNGNSNYTYTSLIRFDGNLDRGGYIGSWGVNKAWLWSGVGPNSVVLVGDRDAEQDSILRGNTITDERWRLVKDFAFFCGNTWPESVPANFQDQNAGWAPVKISRTGRICTTTLGIGTGPVNKIGEAVNNFELSDNDLQWNNQIGNVYFFVKTADVQAEQSQQAKWEWRGFSGQELYEWIVYLKSLYEEEHTPVVVPPTVNPEQ